MTIRINGIEYAAWELQVLRAVEAVKQTLERILADAKAA